ncbi:MAG: Gfo/Idh/MocA family oxidoreductase [Chloroflexota bacterium]
MRVGVLSAAHVHAPWYLAALAAMPDVELAGVWDADPAITAERAATAGARAWGDADALLTVVDAVVVAGVNRDHRALAERAAAVGRHVLCEKPLATTVADARAIVDACERAGVKLMTAFPSRFGPVIGALADALRAGAVGELVSFEGVNSGELPDVHGAWFVDPELAGGGAITDHVVHLADLYRWLSGSEVVEVYAVANRILQGGFDRVETGGLVTLRLANGVVGSIDCSWSRPPGYPTWGGLSLEALGTAGALDVDAFRQHLDVYATSPGAHAAVRWPFFGSDANGPMLREFLAAVRDDRAPSITGIDGLRAVEVVAAAYRSLETGQPVAIAEVAAPG